MKRLSHLDSWCLALLQLCVVDPLQFRGISLLLQYQVVTGLTLILCVVLTAILLRMGAPWWILCIMALNIVGNLIDILGIGPISGRTHQRLQPAPADSPTINSHLSFWRGRLLTIALDVYFVCGLWTNHDSSQSFGLVMLNGFGLFMTLKIYLDACQPKPPRPKRVLATCEV